MAHWSGFEVKQFGLAYTSHIQMYQMQKAGSAHLILQYDNTDRWSDDGNLLLMCKIQTVGVIPCWWNKRLTVCQSCLWSGTFLPQRQQATSQTTEPLRPELKAKFSITVKLDCCLARYIILGEVLYEIKDISGYISKENCAPAIMKHYLGWVYSILNNKANWNLYIL